MSSKRPASPYGEADGEVAMVRRWAWPFQNIAEKIVDLHADEEDPAER